MKSIVLFFAGLLASMAIYSQQIDWETYYEKSNYKETPRYVETIRYCEQLAANSPDINFSYFGESPQGRKLPLLIVNKNGQFNAAEVKESGQAVVMIQACIHPGESEGKDAGLMLLRDIDIHKRYYKLLDNVTILFIPIFNVDGHERWSKYNRINQNGPEEMGWRVTAQNLNLNRDYVIAESPEMKAWLNVFHEWLPDFFIDCHTTDGADYQYVITYKMETGDNIDKALAKWQEKKFIPAMKKNMFSKGYPVFPYVEFRNWHDPRSGLELLNATPMISQGYTALQNRPGLLIETHMLKPYKQRVEGTYELLRFSLEFVNKDYETLTTLTKKADEYVSSADFRKKKFAVKYELSQTDSVMVDFLGVDYTVEKSELTGGDWFKYSSNPETFKVALFDNSIPSEIVDLPEAYLIPPEWTEVIDILKAQHVEMRRLDKERTLVVNSYKFSTPQWRERPYEGRHRLSADYEIITEKRTYPAGTVVVSMNQRNAKLIAYMLEPMANNSLFSWGFFDTVFEQKEYGESYVMEVLAREMLEKDPELRKEFEKKKAEDPNFTKRAWTMLNWFYSKTPYWDNRINKYPIGKVNDLKF